MNDLNKSQRQHEGGEIPTPEEREQREAELHRSQRHHETAHGSEKQAQDTEHHDESDDLLRSQRTKIPNDPGE